MSRTKISEIVAALRATNIVIRGQGMTACAGAIDWAIEELENLTSEETKK